MNLRRLEVRATPTPMRALYATSRGERQKLTERDTRERGTEWAEQIINEWAERLAKTFGNAWGKQPQLAAAAIARYSERMPEKLIEVWKEDGLIEDPDNHADDDPQ